MERPGSNQRLGAQLVTMEEIQLNLDSREAIVKSGDPRWTLELGDVLIHDGSRKELAKSR